MKGDFSRRTFDPKKHYSGVLMQQGRVQLDADWNEQLDIERYLAQTEARDVIGRCGAPIAAPGFQIIVDKCRNLRIGAGRYYVDGILCENEAAVDYDEQPHYPTQKTPHQELQEGKATVGIVYLDVWQRHITPLEDPKIREVALNGADTTTRQQTIWQVKILPLPGITIEGKEDKKGCNCHCGCGAKVAACDGSYEAWDKLFQAPPTLVASTKTPDASQPCLLPPTAGYLRLENQLYRVEIHKGGALGSATFVWSRENGSIVTQLKSINGNKLKVHDLGRDEVLGFRGGDWVEIFDERYELLEEPGLLVQIDVVNKSLREITLKGSPNLTSIKLDQNPRVRRWDQKGQPITSGEIATSSQNIELEDGVQVSFSAGEYKPGQYWLIPARAATGAIEWPKDNNNNYLPQPPVGVTHHYCRLALVSLSANNELSLLADCRKIFSPLTAVQKSESFDYKRQNLYLHGSGVVCGLAARCGGETEKQSITVSPGYAIANDGADLFVEQAQNFAIISAANAKSLITNGGAELSLTLSTGADGSPTLGVEAYQNEGKKSELQKLLEESILKEATEEQKLAVQKILEGTLLNDAFEQCISPLLEKLKAIFQPEADKKDAVSRATKLQIALINLLIQLMQPHHGSHVYLSLEEHNLLKELYESLKKDIQSSSFCGLWSEKDAFPEYPAILADQKEKTLFNKARAQKVVAHPEQPIAYAFDAEQGETLYLFNLEKGELIKEIQIDKDERIQDIVFYTDNDTKEHLLLASTNNGKSYFYTADLQLQFLSKEKFELEGEVSVLRTHNDTRDGQKVLALLPSLGLWGAELPLPAQPNVGLLLALTSLRHHMELIDTPRGVAAIITMMFPVGHEEISYIPPGLSATAYNGLAVVYFEKEKSWIGHVSLQNDKQETLYGEDGFAILLREKESIGLGIAVTNGDQTKGVLLQEIPLRFDSPYPLVGTPISPNEPVKGGISLLKAPLEQKLLLVATKEQFQVERIAWGETSFRANPVPVQISPTSIVTFSAKRNPGVLVANQISKTLTMVEGSLLPRDLLSERSELISYRGKLLRVFTSLLTKMLQSLKDCLCDLLLVRCPECTQEPLTLAHITVKDYQVYKICSFSRAEVITFPKLSYWLSAIPVLPAVDYLVEAVCCAIIPDWFQRQPTDKKDIISMKQFDGARMVWGGLHAGQVFTALIKRFRASGGGMVSGVMGWLGGASEKKIDVAKVIIERPPTIEKKSPKESKAAPGEEQWRSELKKRDDEINTLKKTLEELKEQMKLLAQPEEEGSPTTRRKNKANKE